MFNICMSVNKHGPATEKSHVRAQSILGQKYVFFFK